MISIELPEEVMEEYKRIEPSEVPRERLLCRIHSKKSPKTGRIAFGACFADLFTALTKSSELAYVTFNPFETVAQADLGTMTTWEYQHTKRELPGPQVLNKPLLTEEERYMWLHAGKDVGLLPKDSNIHSLMNDGITVPIDGTSPLEMLGYLMHMRHMWREYNFIKSVLLLTTNSNMSFWQAYVLASQNKLATCPEHTFYPNRWSYCRPDKFHYINLLIIPALKVVHENPEDYDERCIREAGCCETDGIFSQASRFAVWADINVLYNVDLRPLIYDDIIKDPGLNKRDMICYIKKMVGVHEIRPDIEGLDDG